MKQALIAVLVIAVLAVGGFALARNSSNSNNESNNSSVTAVPTRNNSSSRDSATATPTVNGDEDPEQTGGTGSGETSTASLTYGDNGFSQSTVTVKSGSKITITNSSDKVIQPSSGPHPEHTDNSELNFGDIEPGQSKSVTVSQTGRWSLHDHDDPTKKTSIIVQ